jgi:hypothetical protein
VLAQREKKGEKKYFLWFIGKRSFILSGIQEMAYNNACLIITWLRVPVKLPMLPTEERKCEKI